MAHGLPSLGTAYAVRIGSELQTEFVGVWQVDGKSLYQSVTDGSTPGHHIPPKHHVGMEILSTHANP
jgi:hypothetical protein